MIQTCRWCDNIARYVVSTMRRGQLSGEHPACGRHLTRAVDFVSVPEQHVDVERLS